MTAKDVKSIIEKELAQCTSLRTAHGFTLDNVRTRLVEPRLESMRYAGPGGASVNAWIVFDEEPSNPRAGYLVIYDPDVLEFGLACKTEPGQPTAVIGLYGTFLETLKDM